MNKRYDAVEIAKDVRKELKITFPKAKFSVRVESFSGGQSMTVSLMSDKVTPFGNGGNPYVQNGYMQVHHYILDQYAVKDVLTVEAVNMLKQVVEIANRENWDNSDSRTDYYDVNYHFHLEIGQWDKPFKIA